MNESKTSIGNVEIILIIIGFKLGEQYVSLPGTSVSEVGYAAILSVFLGGLLALAVSYLFAKLSINFPDKTVIEYHQEIVGKIIGKVVTAGFLIYFIIFASMYIRRIGEFSKQEFLLNTPIEFIMIVFILLSAYCATGGIPVLSKVSDILIGVGMFTTIVLLVISVPFINLDELRPVFQLESLKKVRVLSLGLVSFTGIEIILFLLPFAKKPKDFKKNVVIALLFIITIYTADIISSMGILSETALRYHIYPVFNVGKTITIPYFFDIRFDIIYASIWIFLIYFVMAGYEYISSVTLANLCNLKSNSVFVVLLAPFFYVIGLLPQSLGKTLEFVKVLEMIWMYGIVGVIIAIYLIGISRKKVKF